MRGDAADRVGAGGFRSEVRSARPELHRGRWRFRAARRGCVHWSDSERDSTVPSARMAGGAAGGPDGGRGRAPFARSRTGG